MMPRNGLAFERGPRSRRWIRYRLDKSPGAAVKGNIEVAARKDETARRAGTIRRSIMTLLAKTTFVGSAALVFLVSVAGAEAAPVTVECSLSVKYRVLTEAPSIDAVDRYRCNAKVLAVSDVDASDLSRRQVVFAFGKCPRLPETVVFGDKDVTEVRKYRRTRLRAHAFAGECSGCVISASNSVSDPRLDSAHFDATFVAKPVDAVSPAPDIMLPAGKGRLTLRGEATDDIIVRAAWAARKCVIRPIPPIYCGGIAGVPCPGTLQCVDYPADDCDPAAGGADCVGICVAPAS